MRGADSSHRLGVKTEVCIGARRVRCVIESRDVFKGGRRDNRQLGRGLAVVLLSHGMLDERAQFALEILQPGRAIKR